MTFWPLFSMPGFLKNPEFWTALVSIVFIILAVLFPGEDELFDRLSAPVAALIVAILGRSAVVQYAAIRTHGKIKDTTLDLPK